MRAKTQKGGRLVLSLLTLHARGSPSLSLPLSLPAVPLSVCLYGVLRTRGFGIIFISSAETVNVWFIWFLWFICPGPESKLIRTKFGLTQMLIYVLMVEPEKTSN